MATTTIERVGYNVLAIIIRFLDRDGKLAVSSTSRAFRSIVKRACRMTVRVSNADEDEVAACLRAWPSVARLVLLRHPPKRVSLERITDLVLEDAAFCADTLRLLSSVRTLSLVRCFSETLDVPELASLVSLSITSPVGGSFPPALPSRIRCVHVSDVSYGILGPISKLTELEALSITRPYPSASFPRPFAAIGAMTTLKSLTLCHVDAINFHFEHIGTALRLDAIRVDLCVVCADDAALVHSSVCMRSNHECSEYTRRVDSRDPTGAASPLCSYETYVYSRIACHSQGLRLLLAARLSQLGRTYSDAVHHARRLLRKEGAPVNEKKLGVCS
jgi:hypothetical protein